jgi:hypothetical protein
MLGMSTGCHALHYLLESPFAGDAPSDAFLYAIHQKLSFAAGPAVRAAERAVLRPGVRDQSPAAGAGRKAVHIMSSIAIAEPVAQASCSCCAC